MKHILKLIIVCLFVSIHQINAQCIGGTLAGSITPTTSWQFVNSVAGGNYYTIAATAGNSYFFSFCSADGGSSIYDTQIFIKPCRQFYVSRS